MKTDRLRESIYSGRNKKLRLLLKNTRKSLNLSIRDLSDRLGVHHSLIGKIEIGDRQLTVIEFINYCNALKINPTKVLVELYTTP